MNQYNIKTGKVYEGRNQVELLSAKQNRGYESDAWITFLQARDLGLKVKKGSVGVSIFKGFRPVETKDKNGNIKVESAPVGFARVFNMDCVEKSITSNNQVNK